MKIRTLHPWKVSYKEAVRIQNELRDRLIIRSEFTNPKLVAGADVSYSKKIARFYAMVVILKYPELTPVEEAGATRPIEFPYIPGLLSFRETPVLLEAFKRVKNIPDVVIVDGQGIAHPRGLGLASHLGLILDLPTVGCAKKRLAGEHREVADRAGGYELLRINGNVVGAVLRTKKGVKPVFISPGHRIDLASSIELVLNTTRGYRLPEPTRQAHMKGGKNVKEIGI
ncbi:MAG: deoxyribonuclease V [Deltaproteobacteria bacterium]|nr:MAG: deoxyribonuclease V [Deltaproteobacteria bacterium]